jgi:CarD family transcriptional regulator
MLFEVGETVVYPHHGAATIIEVKERIIKGEAKKYLKLNVTQGDLIIEVPAENVDLVGVRDVIGKEGLDHVFEVLRAPFTEEPTNWSRRYKANLEKLASGDVIKVTAIRIAVCRRARSGCWPRRVRFSFPSLRSLRRPMKTRRARCSTRSSRPEWISKRRMLRHPPFWCARVT